MPAHKSYVVHPNEVMRLHSCAPKEQMGQFEYISLSLSSPISLGVDVASSLDSF